MSEGATTSQSYRYYDLIVAAFVAVLLISNIASTKIPALGPLNFAGGTLLFPVSYIFGDVLPEVYVSSPGRRVLHARFLANLGLAVFLAAIVVRRAKGAGVGVIIGNRETARMDRFADSGLLGSLSELLPALCDAAT